jgi:hypothetical protein
VSEQESQPDPWGSVPRPDSTCPPAQQPGYGYPPPMPPGAYYGYPPIQAPKTNGLAIASLVCGICGFVYLVPAILGLIFGIVALRQIRREGTEGKGMAVAGIVTGAAWLVLTIVIVLVVIASSGN